MYIPVYCFIKDEIYLTFRYQELERVNDIIQKLVFYNHGELIVAEKVVNRLEKAFKNKEPLQLRFIARYKDFAINFVEELIKEYENNSYDADVLRRFLKELEYFKNQHRLH